jgi:hypothetical protein
MMQFERRSLFLIFGVLLVSSIILTSCAGMMANPLAVQNVKVYEQISDEIIEKSGHMVVIGSLSESVILPFSGKESLIQKMQSTAYKNGATNLYLQRTYQELRSEAGLRGQHLVGIGTAFNWVEPQEKMIIEKFKNPMNLSDLEIRSIIYWIKRNKWSHAAKIAEIVVEEKNFFNKYWHTYLTIIDYFQGKDKLIFFLQLVKTYPDESYPIELVSKYADNKLKDELIKLLQFHKNAYVRQIAGIKLIELGNREIVEQSLLREENASVRAELKEKLLK